MKTVNVVLPAIEWMGSAALHIDNGRDYLYNKLTENGWKHGIDVTRTVDNYGKLTYTFMIEESKL